jgi:hypothetical protein
MRSQSQDKRGPSADTPQGWGAFWWREACQGPVIPAPWRIK